MEDVKLIEKVTIVPAKPTKGRRLFLSNIDLALVSYQDFASFFESPSKTISFSEICQSTYLALGQMLVAYDFIAGRLKPAQDDSDRLEIDCNDAGVVVAAATTGTKMSELGELRAPQPRSRQLVAFLQEEDEGEMKLKGKPLLLIQLTQFGCGGLALAFRYNHCLLDGISVREFEVNMAALTRGEDLVLMPNLDRTIFKARSPPKISHAHYEYSKPIEKDTIFSVRGTSSYTLKKPSPSDLNHLVYLSPERIGNLKVKALKNGQIQMRSCSIFHVVAAKIWKAWSMAMELPDETVSTMLFPVDVRKIMVPKVPHGFAGNALVPGFVRASMYELRTVESSFLVQKVQEGINRLDDEYVRSGVDYLEVHKGVPRRDNSFSLVSWWKLGIEEEEFGWGKVKCAVPIVVKPGLVFPIARGKR